MTYDLGDVEVDTGRKDLCGDVSDSQVVDESRVVHR